MKKYILYTLWAAISVLALAACSDDEGTDPGTDGAPVVTIYKYSPVAPYNSDEDITLRFATNGKVRELYYFAEKKADKDAFIATNGEQAYADRVVSEGSKAADLGENPDFETTLTGMQGLYAITAVAVGHNNARRAYEAEFLGLQWEDVVSGTYKFGILSQMGLQPVPTMLQICTSDDTLYRFKDVFGEGSSMKLVTLPDYEGKDDDGKYVFCRVPNMSTPYEHPTYGVIGVRDIGYMTGDLSNITEGGYESGLYLEGPNKNAAFICVQYYVSAGSLGYDYDFFTPDAD